MAKESKSFRDLVEAMNKKTKKFSTSPDDDQTASLEPKAAGEKAFKDAHTVAKTDAPAGDSPADTSKVPTSQKQGAGLGRGGEKDRPKQGASKLPERNASGGMKQTPSGGREFPERVGDLDVVRTSPSAAKPVKSSGLGKAFKSFREQVEVHTTAKETSSTISPFEGMIGEALEDTMYTFANGDSCTIDPEALASLHEAFNNLSDDANHQLFADCMNESIESVCNLIKFVGESFSDVESSSFASPGAVDSTPPVSENFAPTSMDHKKAADKHKDLAALHSQYHREHFDGHKKALETGDGAAVDFHKEMKIHHMNQAAWHQNEREYHSSNV